MKDFYVVLGIAHVCTAAEIKAAFKKLALETHPDRHGGDKRKEALFKEIVAAYEVLSDEARRAQYDQRWRDEHQSKPAPAAEASTTPTWWPDVPAGPNINLAAVLAGVLGAIGFVAAAAFFEDLSRFEEGRASNSEPSPPA